MTRGEIRINYVTATTDMLLIICMGSQSANSCLLLYISSQGACYDGCGSIMAQTAGTSFFVKEREMKARLTPAHLAP